MVAAHHDVDVVALLDVRFEDHLQAAHSPAGTWRISYSPQIHQKKCYTKPLKSHTEMA